MRGLPLLLISFAVGYSAISVIAFLKVDRGERMGFIKEHGFDVSMTALLSAIVAVPMTVFIGLPVVLFICWFQPIPLQSPERFQLVLIAYSVIYIITSIVMIAKDVGHQLRGRRK